MDLFIKAGVEFNDTNAPIVKTAPWGEKVQHLPGYFYLNGLGDISYNEMLEIWKNKVDVCVNNKARYSPPCRTTFTTGVDSTYANQTTTHNVWGYNFCDTTKLEVIKLFNASGYIGGANNFACAGNDQKAYSKLHTILGTINNGFTAFYGPFYTHIIRVQIAGVNTSFSGLSQSGKLSNASILFMVQKATNGTRDITITLHPNAYARAMADTDIQAAVQANGHITLVSA